MMVTSNETVAMLTSKRQSDNVLSHWYVLMDNFQFSTQEFYDEVEKELTARHAPGLKISTVTFFEGGALSGRRIYLRLSREEFAFDICAAPFGRAYFFSQRFVIKPRPLWPLICLILLLLISAFYAIYKYGLGFFGYYYSYAVFYASNYKPYYWAGLGMFIVLIVAFFLRNYAKLRSKTPDAQGGQPNENKISKSDRLDLYSLICCLPLIGAWHARTRRQTYHRHDSRLMYHTLVSEIVKKKVEEVTAAKGVKLIRTYEYSPILGELYKTATVRPNAESATA